MKKLFGKFDHTIPLNLKDHVTIVLGPNGVGKTILLKFIDHLFDQESDFSLFKKIPFETFRVTFVGEDYLEVEKKGMDSLLFTYYHENQKVNSFLRTNIGDKPVKITGTFPKMQVQFSPEILKRYNLSLTRWERDLIQNYLKARGASMDPRLLEFLKAFLAKTKRSPKINTSSAWAESLLNKLPDAWLVRVRLSIRTRLIGVDRLSILDNLSENTKAIALILKLLMQAVYSVDASKIGDPMQKYFDERLNKLELLAEVLNERFLYKKIQFEPNKGFTLLTDKGLEITPDDLSSGEKNLWRLFTELLFIDTPGTLVLIDEPEMSLHVSWQLTFLEGLQKILEKQSHDVIITTHSPEIVSDKWDWVVELGGTEDGDK